MRAFKGILLLSAIVGPIAGCGLNGSAKISPPESVPGGRFGSAVVASGSLGLIGSPGSSEAGTVYVYDLNVGSQVVDQILPEAATEGDDFGSALDADQDIMVVGAPLHEHQGYIAGAAFVYRHNASSGSWVEEAILASDVAGDLDYFGSSISVVGDQIAIGSPGDDGRGSNAGAVYVYGEPILGWALHEKLVAPDAGPGDRCGGSVASHGKRILVGCPHGFGSGIQSGAAYLFRLVDSVYVLEAKFDPPLDEVGQLFGSAVSLSEDHVFIGAPGPNEEHPDGSVHIFDFDGTVWQSDGVLSAGDRVASRGFGAVLNVDGDLMIVGAQRKEGEHLSPGSAFVYGLSNGEWLLEAQLEGNDIDRADGFGSSVSIQDGHALVGAAGNAEGGSNTGAAYHFTRAGTTWK